jgi:anhydro-N-acetylmuramic acid kinase
MYIIGLMSGTSADGIDATLCEINGTPPNLEARIINAVTRSYSDTLRRRILDACLPHRSYVDALCRLNVELAERFADITLDLINLSGLTPTDIDLIGSHGQTVWHDVLPDGRVGATLQIGESSVIAERTGITTIDNFRARDVAVGGQGAPLTAYVDWLLLRHPTHWRAVQNIGGIGNVTFLPPLSDETSSPLAFDTGPGNVLIDAAVTELTQGALSYDTDGIMAKKGKVDEGWLSALMHHPYYRRLPPKTTGRELFGTTQALNLVDDGRALHLSPVDIIATLTMLTACTIADAYRQFVPTPLGEVILGGGGQRNPVLVAMLRNLLHPTPVLSHEDLGFSSDHKEALVFAVLAYETWNNRPSTLPVLTGAAHPVVLGQITPGTNYPNLIRKTWVTT